MALAQDNDDAANTRARDGDRGVALLFVLIFLAAVGALATAATTTMVAQREASADIANRITLAASADAAIARLKSALEDPLDDLDNKAMKRNAPVREVIGEIELSYAIAGEQGKLSLLGAPLEAIDRYLSLAGVSDGDTRMARELIPTARANNDAELIMAILHGVVDRSGQKADLLSDFSFVGSSQRIDLPSASRRVLQAIPDLDSTEIDAIESGEALGVPLTSLSAYAGPPSQSFMLAAVVSFRGHIFIKRQLVEIAADGKVINL